MNKLFGILLGLALTVGLVGCGDDSTETDGGIIEIDSGTDGGDVDGGDIDAGTDAGVDSGPSCGDFGNACDLTSGLAPRGNCRLSDYCQVELSFDLNSTEDPVRDLPDGESTQITYFAGGFCTDDAYAGTGSDWSNALGLCENDDTVCGDEACGECVTFFSGDAMCMPRCDLSLGGRGGCREGWYCDPGLEICAPGCTNDASCKVTREESNGVPDIQSDFTCSEDPTECCPEGDDSCCTEEGCCDDSEDPDCYYGGTNFDIQIWDTDPLAPSCNLDTGLCEHTNPDGNDVGGTCDADSDCLTGLVCYEETDSGVFQDGFCTIRRCDIEGNECPTGSHCQDRGFGLPVCLPDCTFAEGATYSDPSTWLTATGDCRDGYSCYWNGQDPAGVEGNGGCIPGAQNTAVTTANVGGACTGDSDCWSPFGNGSCFEELEDDDGNKTGEFLDGYCSVTDCHAPIPGAPVGASWCPDDSICVTGLSADDPVYGVCMTACESGDDCRDNYACYANSFCWYFGCEDDTQCPGSQTCVIATGSTLGECRDS